MSADNNKKGSNKQIVFLTILVVVVLVFGASFFIKVKPSANKIITTGDRGPEFTLPAPNGRSVSLSDFRGKVVMVHFWATWCPPCVEELPTLAKMNQSLAGKDFELLAVSVDEGGADAVTSFMQRNNLNVPVLLDTSHAVSSQYGTYKFPETYILDREGIVRYKVIGPRDWREPAALQLLQNMIASR
jgi:peroxiredoxin